MPSLTHSIESVLRTFWLKLWPSHLPQCWFQKKPTHPLPYYSQLSSAKVGWQQPTLVPATGNGKVQSPCRRWLQIASGNSLRATFQACALTGGKDFLRFVAHPGSKVRESALWWLLLPSQGSNVVVTHPWLSKADSRASANSSW